MDGDHAAGVESSVEAVSTVRVSGDKSIPPVNQRLDAQANV
jgi:hypothetical protein